MTPDPLLTTAEVAELLRVSERSVQRLVRAGELPHVRIGRAVRFRGKAVEAWLAARERAGSRAAAARRSPSAAGRGRWPQGAVGWWDNLGKNARERKVSP